MSRNYLGEHLERIKRAGEWQARLLKELAENEQVARQLERQNVLPTGFLADLGEERYFV